MTRPPAAPDVFSAIGHPRRRELIMALAGGEKPVADLVDTLGLAQSTVSEHLGVLRAAGLVRSTKRGREQRYTFEPAPLEDVTEWMATLEAFWGERFHRLGSLLDAMHTADTTDRESET